MFLQSNVKFYSLKEQITKRKLKIVHKCVRSFQAENGEETNLYEQCK